MVRLSAKDAATRATNMRLDFENNVYLTYTALAAAYGVSIQYARNCVIGNKCVRTPPPKGKKKALTMLGVDYFVYENGRIWSTATNKFMATKNGRIKFTGHNRTKTFKTSVARLVLTAFVRPPKPGELARHLDDDRTNNDVTNLEWGYDSDNARDKASNGNQPRGEAIVTAKLTPAQVIDFVNGYDGTQTKIEYCESRSPEFDGMNPKYLMNVLAKRFWKHLWSDKKHIDPRVVKYIREKAAARKSTLPEFCTRCADFLVGKGYQVNAVTIEKIVQRKTWSSVK